MVEKMWQPAWYAQLIWSPARSIAEIRSIMIPLGAGLYVFTRNRDTLKPQNALYVGKADGAKHTLRGRLGTYLSLLRNPKRSASKHPAKNKLRAYYKASPDQLFVRWTGVIVARELEGTLLQMLDPEFQGKEEHGQPYFEGSLGDDPDEELIPQEYLYDVNKL